MGYEKSYSEVLAVKLDEMLRVWSLGEKRKRRIRVCWEWSQMGPHL